MTEVRLFIATTIDGFIARKDGGLDWLPGSEVDSGTETSSESEDFNGHDGGYGKFIAGIDVVVMGRKTYEEVLGFGVDWPYPQCKSYIVTSKEGYETKTDNTYVINNIDEKTINEIKAISEKNIWVVGGGEVITRFLNLNAIDEMTLTVISVILGDGVRLFPDQPKETTFKLVDTQFFDSKMVNLVYRKSLV